MPLGVSRAGAVALAGAMVLSACSLGGGAERRQAAVAPVNAASAGVEAGAAPRLTRRAPGRAAGGLAAPPRPVRRLAPEGLGSATGRNPPVADTVSAPEAEPERADAVQPGSGPAAVDPEPAGSATDPASAWAGTFPDAGDAEESAPEAEADGSFPDDIDEAALFVFPVPLIVNGTVVENQVNVRIDGAGTVALIEKDLLVDALEDLALPGVVDDVDDLEAVNGEIDGRQLAAAGLTGGFDSAAVAFAVEVPLDRRPPQNISGRPDRPLEPLTDPTVSAAVNMFVEGNVTYNEDIGELERDPLEVDLDGALRLGANNGVTFETFVSYVEDEETEVRTVSATYDQRQAAIRVIGGDFLARTEGFQTGEELLGLTVERNFSLRPGYVTGPRNVQTFVLDRSARVSVVVDGVELRALRLPPGRYSISDLERRVGATDVLLLIDDGTGAPEQVLLSAFSGPTLLGRGVIDFAASVGYRSDPVEADNAFADFDDEVASAFVRVGVTDFLTLGAGYQRDSVSQLATADISAVSRYAGLDVDAGYSDASGTQGYAVEGDALLIPEAVGLPEDVSLRATALYQSRDFTEFGDGFDAVERLPGEDLLPIEDLDDLDDPGGLPDRWVIDIRAAAPLGDWARSGLTLNYTDRRSGPDSIGVEPSISFNLFERASIRISGEVVFEDSDVDYAAVLSINVLFDDSLSGSSTTAFESDEEPTATASLRRNSAADRVGALGYEVGVERREGVNSVNGRASYTGNRFLLEVDANTGTLDGAFDSNGRVLLASSLVFADGHVAIGRPVSDAFAIVYPDPSLDGRRIRVAPREEGPLARTDFLGPAVVPDISANRPRVLDYEVDDVPIGVDLGGEQFRVLLPFRGGAALRVGSGGVVSAVGVALGPDGAPLALVAGSVSSDEVDLPPDAQVIFTNQAGRFVLPQLSAGTYRLTLPGDLSASLTVPEGTLGVFEVGEVRFAPDG